MKNLNDHSQGIEDKGGYRDDIVIVDDLPDNLRLLSEILGEQGYRVRCANSGKLALKIVGLQPPDLILLDIKMPGMDGYEVCERLKADSATRDIPVIFISGLSDTGDKLKAFEAGGVDYIDKPFRFEEVLARVRTQLSIGKMQKQMAQQNEHLTDLVDRLRKTQEELVEARKMASLGFLVTGIAHEMNTPLGIGITSASYLSDITKDIETLFNNKKITHSELKQFIDSCLKTSRIILTSLQNTGELVERFKQLSMEHLSSEPARFNLKSLLLSVSGDMAAHGPGSGVHVDIRCPENLELVSYKDALEQVLFHLFQNAVIHGFGKEQKGTVTIEAQTSGERLSLSFTDNGAGIQEAVLPMIFDPFFTTSKQKGMGLGLHIVFNTVTLKLGGSIRCKSPAGRGTTFIITLPVAVPEAGKEEEKQ